MLTAPGFREVAAEPRCDRCGWPATVERVPADPEDGESWALCEVYVFETRPGVREQRRRRGAGGAGGSGSVGESAAQAPPG